MKRASKAQATRLAGLWQGHVCQVSAYNDPTTKTLLERGWIVSNNRVGTYPSGATYEEHVISRAGIVALRDYLTKVLSDG